MSTPTGGEWMSAQEALQFLTPSYIPRRARADAARAISTRAHAGLIKARAKLLIFQDKEETNVEVPREFWWAKGEEVDLAQDWASGDFETFLNHRSVRLQAFGVEFKRQDIERMKPASAANPTPSPSPAGKPAGQTVFIGHGHSEEWRKLYIFLQNDHDLRVIEFNSSSAAGIATTDHLQDMLGQANFAFLILTGEDEQATGEFNPRLNVVHEAGLFQGKLGFRKAILFLEEGCREFSNVRGLTHIPFPKGKIEAQFHEATRVLKREMLID
jgi:predicted nucleotide-binding protein